MVPYWIAQVDAAAACSLLGFVLITIPLFWLLRAWNAGCVLYILWTGGRCLTSGINILLWRENTVNFAPVWCDIYIRFYMASGIGVVSSGLAITHRLYHIANITTTNPTTAQRRRNLIIDLFIGLGIPMLSVALYWFYEGHRFNIYEGLGCIPAYPTTFLSIFLNAIWPILIGLVSAPYAVLALRAVRRHTKELKQLQVFEPGLTMSGYYRLIALATADIFFTVPLSIYVLVTGIRNDAFYPYRGLVDLHFNFGRILRVPAVVWRQDPLNESVINFTIWMPIASAIWFFSVFGFTAEALTHYRLVLTWAAKRLGVSVIGGPHSHDGDTSVVTTISFQRRVAGSRISDNIRDNRSTTQPAPAVDDGDDLEHRSDSGARRELPKPATLYSRSACCSECSLRNIDVSDMS